MKLTVSKIQLMEILTQHFGTDVTDIVITKPSAAGPKLLEALAVVINKNLNLLGCKYSGASMPEFIRRPDQKIQCIKALREVTSTIPLPKGYEYTMLGIVDAKWAIENWDRYYAFVCKHGRHPSIIAKQNGEFATLK